MRIISGEARGRQLRAPRGAVTRPTADRVREALFNLLGSPEGLHVLDLFAGTGALALEALSRGAASAVMVDHGEPAVRTIRENVSRLGVETRARVLRADARRALRRLTREGLRFDLVFLDPPYGAPVGDAVLREVGEGDLLEPGAVVVMEHDRHHLPPDPCGRLACRDRRRYGQTEVSIYCVAAPDPISEGEA